MTQKKVEINESLDLARAGPTWRAMIYTRINAAAVLAASLLLAACEAEPVVVGQAADPQAEALKNAPPVQLPPTMRDKTYRCKDNSVVYMSFSSDEMTVLVRDKEEEPPVATLKAPAAGQPFEGQGETGKGFRLVGSGDSVTYTSPDSGTQTCRT